MGAGSVGAQLIAFGGRDDGLFRADITQSGGPTGMGIYRNASAYEPDYQEIVQQVGCSGAVDTLACLRTVPTTQLSNVFNSTSITPALVIDNDFIIKSGTTLVKDGNFVRVPLLTGTNFDEGTSFAARGVNTDEEFKQSLLTTTPGLNHSVIDIISKLYPDDPNLGIPSTLKGRPPVGSPMGTQFKRAAAYIGDLDMHAGRRITTQAWARYGVPVYSYHFDVLVNGLTPYNGSSHFQEVAFVFNNVNGYGYETAISEDPFANEPSTFEELASIMSTAWISFANSLNPNNNAFSKTKGINNEGLQWPLYRQDNPSNMVFNVNVTGCAYIEPDTYRSEAIAYMADNYEVVWGK